MCQADMIEVARYRVIFADCDPMRIMYFGSYFRLVERGWTELFRALGYPLPEFASRGLYLAMVDAHCQYAHPVRYDDQLSIRAMLTDVGPAHIGITYEIVREGTGVVAYARTTHAVVNENGRPQRVPTEIMQLAPRTARRGSPAGHGSGALGGGQSAGGSTHG
jgi:acyl-CoA thioester hydrolase